MHGNAILYGSDPNENDNFEERAPVMHGNKMLSGAILTNMIENSTFEKWTRSCIFNIFPRCCLVLRALGEMLRKMFISSS